MFQYNNNNNTKIFMEAWWIEALRKSLRTISGAGAIGDCDPDP